MKLFNRILLLIVMVGLVSLGAFATDATGSLAVSANVNSSCAVSSSTTLAFGSYNPTSTTDTDQTGTFTVQCTNGTSATIKLGQGANASAGSTDAAPVRNMLNGTSKLNYQLYTTAARTTPWDNATGQSQTADGTVQSINVYGRIPNSQSAIAGTYGDTVQITVTY